MIHKFAFLWRTLAQLEVLKIFVLIYLVSEIIIKRPKAIMPVIILNSSELSSAVSEIPDSYGNST